MGRLTYKGLVYKTRNGRQVYSYDKFAPAEEYIPPSPTPTPTASVTPSVTPSPTPTPSVTPSSTPIPITPSVTPTLTPTITQTNTPTPSITPTHTPTPSTSPVPQFFILAENTDEILTESGNNLITQDGDSEADVNMVNFAQGVLVQVTNGDTSTEFVRTEVTQDSDTGSQNYTSSVNLEFSWTHMVPTDSLYRIDIYERDDESGGQGRLLESSSSSNNGSYTYTGKTSVIAKATQSSTNGQTLNITAGVGQFTWAGNNYVTAGQYEQWGIDTANNNTPWGSTQYQTGIITPGDPGLPQYKLVFVRTSLGAWTRYTYTFSTQTWTNPQNISTGVSNYGASDQVTLVNNLP